MNLLIMIVIGIIFFAIGVIYLYWGYFANPDGASWVPIAEMERVQRELNLAEELRKKVEAEARMLHQDLSRIVDEAKRKEEAYLHKIHELQEETAKFKERESTLSFSQKDKEERLEQANEMVAKLNVQTESLKAQLAQLESRTQERTGAAKELEETIANLRQDHQRQLEEFQSNLATLKSENRLLQDQIGEGVRVNQQIQEALLASQRDKQQQLLQANDTIHSAQTQAQEMQHRLESVNDRVRQLEEDLQTVRKDRDQQASQKDTLKYENQSLSSESQRAQARITQLEESLAVIQTQGAGRKDQDNQLVVANATVETLRASIYSLESQLDERIRKITQVEENFSALQRERDIQMAQTQATIENLNSVNHVLQEDMKEGIAKSGQLERELTTLRISLDKRLSEADSEVENLKTANQALKKQLSDRSKKVTDLGEEAIMLQKQREDFVKQSRQTMDALRKDREKFMHEKEKLETELKTLREQNALLLEKDKIVQYEYTKARAQASGLEKVSTEFKIQLDGVSKDTEDLRVQNRSLLRHRKDADKVISELRHQNDQMLKREKDSQGELEKTLALLNSVEKVYSEFKNKMEKTV